MKNRIKEAAIDLVKWAVGLTLLLGAFYLFGTIRAHHALVNQLVEFFEAQTQAQQQRIAPPAPVEPLPR